MVVWEVLEHLFLRRKGSVEYVNQKSTYKKCLTVHTDSIIFLVL